MALDNSSLCPESVSIQIPLLISQIFAVPSKEPVKTLSPSVVKDNEIISP